MNKVLHVCPYLHPLAGGPAILIPRYSELLPDHGWDASILTTDWYSPGGRDELVERYAEQFDITVLPTGDNRWLTLLRSRYQPAQRAFKQADIIHVHGLWHPLGWLARNHATASGKPFVVSPHGMLDPYSVDQGKLKKTLYFQLVEKQNLENAARVIFTSEQERGHIPQPLIDTLVTEVVLLGVDDPPEKNRKTIRKEFLNRFPELDGRKVILFLGRLHQKKGPHKLIQMMPEIIRQVPDAMLLIVGEGESGYVKTIIKDVAALKLTDHVTLSGFIEPDDRWGAMSASDIFVLPSMQENFALAVAETMKMGVPVVISDRVDIWPYIEQAGAGEVLGVTDQEQWSATIIKLLLDDEKREVMGNNAKALADEKFSWQSSTAHLATIYDSVLGETA